MSTSINSFFLLLVFIVHHNYCAIKTERFVGQLITKFASFTSWQRPVINKIIFLLQLVWAVRKSFRISLNQPTLQQHITSFRKRNHSTQTEFYTYGQFAMIYKAVHSIWAKKKYKYGQARLDNLFPRTPTIIRTLECPYSQRVTRNDQEKNSILILRKAIAKV